MRTFSSLTHDEHVVIWAAVDLPTLLALRSCSQHALQVVSEVLRVSLRQLCADFVDDTTVFLESLVDSRGVIGGQVAVRFMLRDLTFVPDALEVFVPALAHLELQKHLVEVQHATLISSYDSPENDDEAWLLAHALHYTDVLRTPYGRTIKLHRCSEADALAAVACSSTSAEVTYVSPERFGTAYPALLFRHRALVADWRVDANNSGLLRWRGLGIDLRMAARVWEEYEGMYCAAAKWVCHTQRRRFTDSGALAVRLDPRADLPLRSGVVWRLDMRPCGGRCLHLDYEDDGAQLYKYNMM